MTITINDMLKNTRGHKGRVYIARKGTVTVIIITDGDSYLINNRGGAVITNPVDNYWIHGIDWQAAAYVYFTYGMDVDESVPELAEMHLGLDDKWRKKLKETAEYHRALLKTA